ncbi:hypothetical protein FB45DRAFT_900036 [Roridomyces roridus]|uniref:Acetyl-CoA synthetase-like protein n=1 Tax=Roridomyces roridus TaxID=1738132 RepID=A0AAD7FWJ6_9AGAR|nr:hypothetical protein FB45DRAFT_900036 [Roridomyces roridus]
MYIKSTFPPLPPVPEVNVHHILFGRPDQAEWPDFNLYIEEKTGRKRTFKDLYKRIEGGATALGAPVAEGGLGLNGDGEEIVGLVGDNSLDYVDIVHSLLRITTPFALISTYSTRFEMVHALKLTKATRLFVDARLVKNVLAALDDPDVHISPDKIYVLAGHPSKNHKSFGQMIEAIQRKNVPVQGIRPAKKDTLAYLVMSSGTSGLPKAVMITHGNLICSIVQASTGAQIAEPFGPPKRTDHPVTISVLPLFHSYGLHVTIIRATLAPATHVIIERWNTAQYLKLIPKYRATHLTLVPSAVHQLVTHPKTKTTDLSSVLMVGSGAAYLPPELASRFLNLLPRDSDVGQGYGLSEATIAAMTRPHNGMCGMGIPPPRTTGILVPGMEARTVLSDGSEAPAGVVGELWLRGGNVMAGYWNNPTANAGAFAEGGWLRTGDMFSAVAGGYFFFADRGKDTLKISGEQVSPKEIEDALFAQPDKLISDVTVAGVSGGRTADEKVPRAWIVLSGAGKKRGAAETIKVLDAWHKEMLSRWKWLRGGIEVVKELPKSPTGKIMRRVLQDDYERRLKKGKAKL